MDYILIMTTTTTTEGMKMENQNETKEFKAGTAYQSRSTCDHNCIWTVNILKRTAKFITVKIDGDREIKRVGVYVRENEEYCNFLGNFSMRPSIRAGRMEA